MKQSRKDIGQESRHRRKDGNKDAYLRKRSSGYTVCIKASTLDVKNEKAVKIDGQTMEFEVKLIYYISMSGKFRCCWTQSVFSQSR